MSTKLYISQLVCSPKMSTRFFLNWFAAQRCQQDYFSIGLQPKDVNNNMSQLVCSSQMSTKLFLNWFAARRCQLEYVPISLQLKDVNIKIAQLVCSSKMSKTIFPSSFAVYIYVRVALNATSSTAIIDGVLTQALAVDGNLGELKLHI